MSEESNKNPCGSDYNFVPSLINSYPLPDVKFVENCLINGNISNNISSNNKSIYFLQTRHMVKGFKHRFHIR